MRPLKMQNCHNGSIHAGKINVAFAVAPANKS